MSKGQALLCLVKERLALAAEDIFVLFERTIAEYEEELCRYRDENQRKQQLLEQLLSRCSVPVTSSNCGTSLSHKNLVNPCLRHKTKEQSFVKEEEEQPLMPVTQSSVVSVNTEEPSLLQHNERETREDTQGQDTQGQGLDISSETHFLSDTELSPHTDRDEDCGPSLTCSAAEMETEAEENDYHQVLSTDRESRLSPSQSLSFSADVSEAEEKKHQCPFCQKRFGTKQTLKTHFRVHTGEKPFGCPVCKKNFTQKSSLNLHLRIHTGEKPFCCSFCNKTFAQKCNLKTHMITHQGLTFQPRKMFGDIALNEGM